ncbi:MAG: J domain-containing protein [Planctomycetota bacterium]
MSTEAEFHEALGIAPEASAEEIRRAYRRAALKYHPDRRPDDPAAAEKFRRVTELYRSAMLLRRKELGGRKFTPQDFAVKDWPRPSVGIFTVARANSMSWLERLGGRRLVLPTLNENFFFVCFWAVALALSLVVINLMDRFYLADRTWQTVGMLDVVIFAAVPLATYFVAVAGTLVVLFLTRQIVYLATQLRLACQRALPSGRKDAVELPER